jgi:hypothetical protein
MPATCTHIVSHTCCHIQTLTPIYTHAQAHMYTLTQIHTSSHKPTNTHIDTHTHMHRHTFTYTYKYTHNSLMLRGACVHTHTYIHTVCDIECRPAGDSGCPEAAGANPLNEAAMLSDCPLGGRGLTPPFSSEGPGSGEPSREETDLSMPATLCSGLASLLSTLLKPASSGQCLESLQVAPKSHCPQGPETGHKSCHSSLEKAVSPFAQH